MNYQDQRIFRHPLVLIVLYLFFFIGLPGSVSPVHAKLPADLSAGICVLAKYKSVARQQARLLVNLAANDNITKDDYHKGQSLYAEAKAGFDGWIDQLVFEIEFGSKEAISSIHKTIEEKAKARGNEFVEFVREQNPGSGSGTRGPIADKIKNVFEVIVNGISRLSTTEQTAVIKKLKGYKWPEFHTIEESLLKRRE